MNKAQLAHLAQDDPDEHTRQEVIMAKKEKAKHMKEIGYSDEDIREDVWHRPNQWCQGTCGGFLTWEAYNAGLDMCMECKYEAMG
jgi:hypothetical protein